MSGPSETKTSARAAVLKHTVLRVMLMEGWVWAWWIKWSLLQLPPQESSLAITVVKLVLTGKGKILFLSDFWLQNIIFFSYFFWFFKFLLINFPDNPKSWKNRITLNNIHIPVNHQTETTVNICCNFLCATWNCNRKWLRNNVMQLNKTCALLLTL